MGEGGKEGEPDIPEVDLSGIGYQAVSPKAVALEFKKSRFANYTKE